MWPFDFFKKKTPTMAEPALPALTTPPAKKSSPPHMHAPHVHVSKPRPALVASNRPHGRLRRYLIDPVPSKKPTDDDTQDAIVPSMVGGFLVGELLGSQSAPPIDDSPSDTPSFSGFGGGESGGAGASGSWDNTPSVDTSSSNSDNNDGSSSDSSSYDGGSSSDSSSSFDSGSSSGSDSSGF